jgi:cell wall assembly regulator SMI1
LVINESKTPLNASDITRLEAELGVKLPDDYRTFLLAHNGGWPEADSFHSYGGEKRDEESIESVDRFLAYYDGEYNNLLKSVNTYKGRIPPHFLPVANDPGGNLILLGVSGPDRDKVFFWDHELEADEDETPDYSNLLFVADSFQEFLDSLREVED